MALSYFFTDSLLEHGKEVVLDEETSKHITQVLRMKTGEELALTDGRGVKANAIISDDHRKRCSVKIISLITEKEALPKIAIAISLIKNSSRFEWFLEKATEIGINEIIPLICERTEKEKFRHDRLKNILISAMLQSQQCWMPVLHEPTSFKTLIGSDDFGQYNQKFIAHCMQKQKDHLSDHMQMHPSLNRIILIGPEGDFTEQEIDAALQSGFTPVALGNTRLRTETAGMVAAALLRIVTLSGKQH